MSKAELEGALSKHKASLAYYGNKATNTGWYVDTICLQGNKRHPLLVYGVGAGEDISWDTTLVDRYGAQVHVFDPTEKSIAYTTPIVQKYATLHPGKLYHTAEGLHDNPGVLEFQLPANPDHVSMRIAELASKDMTVTVRVAVNTLHNWMKERGHLYLDILKLDIEGSEYNVLEDLIAKDYLPFTQLLVEYHNRFLEEKGNVSRQETSRHRMLLEKLRNAGFAELWSSNGGQEVGYIKVADLAYCDQNHNSVMVSPPRYACGGGRLPD